MENETNLDKVMKVAEEIKLQKDKKVDKYKKKPKSEDARKMEGFNIMKSIIGRGGKIYTFGKKRK